MLFEMYGVALKPLPVHCLSKQPGSARVKWRGGLQCGELHRFDVDQLSHESCIVSVFEADLEHPVTKWQDVNNYEMI